MTIKNIGLLLLLVGVLVFPVGINQSYAQTNEPTAPVINIQTIQGSIIDIPFGEHITDTQTEFSDLTISFNGPDLKANNIFVETGATLIAGSPGDASFTVIDEVVVIRDFSTSSSGLPVPRTIVLTYTVSDGEFTSTGRVNIFIVESITSTFDGDLDDRTFNVAASSLPTFTETFDGTAFADLLNVVDTFALPIADIDELVIRIDATGSQNGTATFTHNANSDNFLATLTYTQDVGFVGTETFAYTGTGNDVIASGTLTFIVEPNSVPTTPVINIQTIQGSITDIPFGEHITDIHTEFSDLAISFNGPDLKANNISVETGATLIAGSPGDASFTVIDEVVIIRDFSSSSSGLPVPRTIVLTYTVSDGELTSTGRVNIFIVESITSTFDGDLDDRTYDIALTSLPVYTVPFDCMSYMDLLNVVDTFGLDENNVLDIAVTIDAIGSQNGTATFTPTGNCPGFFIGAFTYTPTVGFSGTETFTYTGTGNDVIASGTFTFNVEAKSPFAPTTPNIEVTAEQGADGVINFGVVTDDSDTFADFDPIRFNLRGVNPESDISAQIVLNSEDITFTGSTLFVIGETLRFTVNDDATLGTYNLRYFVRDSENFRSTGNVIFTIVEKLNTAPTTPVINIQTIQGSIIDIPFGDHITDAESSYSGLTISFNGPDLKANNIFVETGATLIVGSPGDASFTVIDEVVVIRDFSTSSVGLPVPRTIVLTYTVSDGDLTSTGRVNIFIVASILSTFNGYLDDRTFNVAASSLPMYTETFNLTEYSDLINHVSIFTDAVGIDSVSVTIDDASHEGTATFTYGATLTAFAILTYTPAEGFAGTETFTYTGTTDDVIASGTLTFIVEEVTCETSLNAGVDFGELGVGVTSDTSSLSLSNDGNVTVQSLIAGANWLSVEDASISIMDVGQTRYSVTETDAFDARTPFTATPVNVGDDISESGNLDIYLQLFVELIDQSFRGDTTQTMTVTSDCSENP